MYPNYLHIFISTLKTIQLANILHCCSEYSGTIFENDISHTSVTPTFKYTWKH